MPDTYHRCDPDIRAGMAAAIEEAWEKLIAAIDPDSGKIPEDFALEVLRRDLYRPLLESGMEVSDLPTHLREGDRIRSPWRQNRCYPFQYTGLSTLSDRLDQEAFGILETVQETWSGRTCAGAPGYRILLADLYCTLAIIGDMPSLMAGHPDAQRMSSGWRRYGGTSLRPLNWPEGSGRRVEYTTHGGEDRWGILPVGDDHPGKWLDWAAVMHSVKRTYWEGVQFPNYLHGTVTIKTEWGSRTIAWSRLRPCPEPTTEGS